jgi:hypothetical protein
MVAEKCLIITCIEECNRLMITIISMNNGHHPHPIQQLYFYAKFFYGKNCFGDKCP